MYYLNLFTYLIGGLFEHVVWHVKIDCRSEELTHIPLPNSNSTTYGDYIANFIRDKVVMSLIPYHQVPLVLSLHHRCRLP